MKTIAIAKVAFTGVGFALLVAAALIVQQTRAFLAAATHTEGIVVELVESRSSDSTTYRPAVEFADAAGRSIRFVSSSGSNPPGYAIGERVGVFYLPATPHEAKLDGTFALWGAATIVGGLGGAFFLVGAGMMVVPLLGSRRRAYLRQHGTPIETTFQRVVLNEALTVNGRHPFRIVSQWLDPATSRMHVFESENLWFDPTAHVDRERITVYIEKNNPKKYWVDLSFLPALAS